MNGDIFIQGKSAWERNVTDEQKKGFLDGCKQIRPNAQIFKV